MTTSAVVVIVYAVMKAFWPPLLLAGYLASSCACATHEVKVPRPSALKPWDTIAVHGIEEAPVEGRLLLADDNGIFLLRNRIAPPHDRVVILSSRVEKALVAIGAQWPDVYEGRAIWSDDSISVSRDGIVEQGRRVYALTDVVVRVQRANEVDVTQAKISWLGTGIGLGTIGFLIVLAGLTGG